MQIGFVASLNHPGANMTGVSQLSVVVGPKLLQLLHEAVPSAAVMALLVNPANPAVAEAAASEMLVAARTLGLELRVLNAADESDLEEAFSNLSRLRVGGLVITAGDPFFAGRARSLAALAMQHAVPTVSANPEFVVAGGLASYGSDIVKRLSPHRRLCGPYS